MVMKKLIVVASMILVSYVSNAQTTIGVTSSINGRGALDVNYGGWIDFRKWGVDYVSGAQISNNDPKPFILGQAKSYTAGSFYRNYGIHVNEKVEGTIVSWGGGIQDITDITTSGNISNTLPYISLGVGKNFSNDAYNIKGTLVIAKIPSIGIGFGIILK